MDHILMPSFSFHVLQTCCHYVKFNFLSLVYLQNRLMPNIVIVVFDTKYVAIPQTQVVYPIGTYSTLLHSWRKMFSSFTNYALEYN